MVVGAGLVAALTPMTGTQLRKLVLDLMNARNNDKLGEEPVDQQLERMAGEGGVAQEVNQPRFESHS